MTHGVHGRDAEDDWLWTPERPPGVVGLEPEYWDAFVAALERPTRELPELDRAIAAYRDRYGDTDY